MFSLRRVALLVAILNAGVQIVGSARVSGNEKSRGKSEQIGTTSEVQKRGIAYCRAITTIVDKHNDFRRMEGASDMKKMRWNSKLGLAAERYAQKCIWDHGDLETEGLSYREVGQNLYSSRGESVNYEFIIQKWYEEKSFFNFTARTCVAGKLCGHYTQMVWSNSSDIGCAHKLCGTLTVPNKWSLSNYDYIVCYYGPSGNYREIPTYKVGKPCDACAEGFDSCDNGLCSSGPGHGDEDDSFGSSLCSNCGHLHESLHFILYPLTPIVTTLKNQFGLYQ